MKKINQYLTSFVVLLLFFIASGAFVLSFDVLRKEAIFWGVNPSLAWIFPLVVDTSIVAGSAFVIWASVNRRRWLVRIGYGVILLVTGLSVTLNAAHAKSFELLPVIYMIVPPLMVALMTFLVERMLEVTMEDVETESKLQTLVNRLQGTVTYKDETIARLESNLQSETARRNQLESDYATFADTIKVLPFINPDVFLYGRVRAGLITMDEALQAQQTYQRRNQAESFADRVTIAAYAGCD